MKILYLSRNDGTDIRLTKMCNSLVALGHDVLFVGWDRTPEKAKDINLRPEVQRRILLRQGVFAKSSFQGWGDYFKHVVKALREERPDAVQAINEEKAALVLPFKHTYFRYLIIDVFDSVIANKYQKRWIDWLAIICRQVANQFADVIIETSNELRAQLGRFSSKAVVIENAPLDPGSEISKMVPTSGPIKLAIGGGLTKKRMGLDVLLAALDMMPKGSVLVEASGWLVDDFAKDVFAKHPAVNYRWFPNPKDFLQVSGMCDALLYLRSDAHESAYRAAVLPNRIFDALAVGRPVIINPELLLADWVKTAKLGYVLESLTPEALVKVLQQLPAARPGLPAYAAGLREMFIQKHTWNVMEKRLNQLYQGLGG